MNKQKGRGGSYHPGASDRFRQQHQRSDMSRQPGDDVEFEPEGAEDIDLQQEQAGERGREPNARERDGSRNRDRTGSRSNR